MEWQTSFCNEPNFNGVIRVMCSLCAADSKGRYEYTYTVSLKDKSKETEKNGQRNDGKGARR